MLTSSLKWQGSGVHGAGHITSWHLGQGTENLTTHLKWTPPPLWWVPKPLLSPAPPTSGPARGCFYPASLGRHFPFLVSLCEQGINPGPGGVMLGWSRRGDAAGWSRRVMMLQDGPEGWCCRLGPTELQEDPNWLSNTITASPNVYTVILAL